MSTARLPLAYRDSCAHLLIPLNQCRFDEFYLPWKCEVSTEQAASILRTRPRIRSGDGMSMQKRRHKSVESSLALVKGERWHIAPEEDL